MALSRRQFVQTVGIGAGAALTTSVWGRGREHSIWSAIEPNLEVLGREVLERPPLRIDHLNVDENPLDTRLELWLLRVDGRDRHEREAGCERAGDAHAAIL